MDFDAALKEVGEFGFYQRKIFFITNILAFVVSAQMLIMVFTTAKQNGLAQTLLHCVSQTARSVPMLTSRQILLQFLPNLG